jgi:hypothetical protein
MAWVILGNGKGRGGEIRDASIDSYLSSVFTDSPYVLASSLAFVRISLGLFVDFVLLF